MTMHCDKYPKWVEMGNIRYKGGQGDVMFEGPGGFLQEVNSR